MDATTRGAGYAWADEGEDRRTERQMCVILLVLFAAHKLIDAPDGLDPIEVRPSKDPKVAPNPEP
jgi:hypothetical protein